MYIMENKRIRGPLWNNMNTVGLMYMREQHFFVSESLPVGATAFTHSLSWPPTRPPRRHATAVQEALGRLHGRRRLRFLDPRAAATASSVRGRYGRRRHQRPQQRARGRRRCREEGDGSGARRAGSAENSPHYPGSCVRHTRVHPCCGDSGRLRSI